MAPRLRIVPIGQLPDGAAEGLAASLSAFGFSAEVSAGAPRGVAALLSPGQKVLDGNFALAALRRDFTDRVLGLCALPLRDDTRPWVYGLAEVNGRAAVFSTDTFYRGGLSPAESVERLSGAVLHELSHTLGMVHCRQRGCLMSATHEPSAMRRLAPRFCENCTRQWKARLGALR